MEDPKPAAPSVDLERKPPAELSTSEEGQQLFRADLNDRLRAALQEDLGAGDITTQYTVPAEATGKARVVAKSEGILCGVDIASRVYALVDESLRCGVPAPAGSRIIKGQTVMTVEGRLQPILVGERVALNFIKRLSGIATLTRRYMDALPPGAIFEVCDTRKTTPLWRDLERHAVRAGGGKNHRRGLWDMVMVKSTHADVCGGLEIALERLREAHVKVPIAVEARTLDEARIASRYKVDLLMLDNMNDAEIEDVIAELKGVAPIEVTGNVTPGRLVELVRLGVNRVSVGALTHSAPALDFALRIEKF